MFDKEKNRVKLWFLKNIILPNNEVMDKPGYVISKYVGAKTLCYIREVFFPELIIANIEKNAVEKFGKKGKEALYEAGKFWGMRYAASTLNQKKSNMSEKDFLDFADIFMQLIESEYSTKTTYKIDYSKNWFEAKYENLMICRLNGLGYFLPATMSGAWQHIVGVQTEATHPSCQGRGDSICTIQCAPVKNLKGNEIFKIKTPTDLGLEKEYFSLNKVKKAQYAQNSFRDLLQAGIFKYDGGFFQYKNERYLLNEASFVYFLELAFAKLKGGNELLFNSAFGYFKDFGIKQGASAKLISDFLPALGWGDVFFDSANQKVICASYPWTKYYKDTTFPIFRGMLSGLVSSFAGKEVKFNKAKTAISGDSLDLVLQVG